MCLNVNKIEAIEQDAEKFLSVKQTLRCVRQANGNPCGFTLVELVVAMVIIGILAAIAAPRFFDNNVFQARGFADQVQASLRYAQKQAIAQRRNTCVAMTASTITLTIANASGAASPCNTNLAFPAGGNTITAPSGVTLSPAVTINFDALGSTTPPQTITVSGATNSIVVEAETGYVHSP